MTYSVLAYSLISICYHRYGKWATTEYALEKCKESYGMNNAIGYPHEERTACRPTYRVSGIHKDLTDAGAFMGFHAGWEQPDWYALPGEAAEYKPSFYRLVNQKRCVSSKVIFLSKSSHFNLLLLVVNLSFLERTTTRR